MALIPSAGGSPAIEEADDDEFFEQWLRGEDLEDLSDLLKGEVPEMETAPPALRAWEIETVLSTGTGYRDNVRRSAINREGGTFLLGGFETMALRVSERVQFFALLEAEHREFLFDGDLPSDSFVGAIGGVQAPVTDDITASLLLRSFFLDQIVDVATRDRPTEPPQEVRGHGVALFPSIKKTWPAELFTEISATGSRQMFRRPLYNYWESGPKVTVGWAPVNSELALSLEYLRRDYDDRPALNRDGEILEGGNVNFRIFRPVLSFRHTWRDTGWYSRSRLGHESNRDDATGFFDYDRIHLAQHLGYASARWEVEGRLDYSRFDYDAQTTQPDGPALRREAWEFSFEIRRKVTESLEVFGGYDRESIRSNDPGLDYNVNTWMAGAGWRF